MHKIKYIILATMLAALVSCGGGQEPAPAAPEPEENAPGPDDGVTVEGGRGSMGLDEVRPVFDVNQERLGDCYALAVDDVGEFVSGSVTIDFLVKEDGSVGWAYVSESDLGSQRVHRCVVKVVTSMRFPHPHGGQAEASYTLDLALDGVGPDLQCWGADNAAEAIGTVSSQIENCMAGNTGVALTLYVDKGGEVVESGASSASQDLEEEADCLSDASRSWVLPDPGETMAKLTLRF